MSSHSRKGRKIARRACDLCRDRKIQCLFDAGNVQSCQKCSQSEVPCTFLTERRPRGPPNRRVIEAQRRARVSPALPSEGLAHGGDAPSSLLPLQIGNLTIEHLVPRHTFRALIAEFLTRVYPLLPLVHVPEFSLRFEAGDYDRDPRFFRLCIAICAVTMASIPRQVETYACDLYQDAGQLVERAAHIVLTCRLSSDMSWQQKPSTSDMLVSVMLSMAAHYAEWAHIGWAYASEATHAFRGLELYRREAHINLTVIESELCKRAFWIMYIMQIHDRLSHITPHTSLCYEPMRTDWNFMLPIEASDFDLGPSRDSGTNTETYHGRRPIIYGFIALIRTFLYVAEVSCRDLSGPRLIKETNSDNHCLYSLSTTPGEATATSSRNEALLAVVSNLQSVLGELPDGLRLSSRSSAEDSPHVEEEDTSIICHQYAIMRVNIHVTNLYLQSTLLDLCLGAAADPAEYGSSESGPDTSVSRSLSDHKELWDLKENIVRELLYVLENSTTKVLEANGLSLIVKIREIAASLLVENDNPNDAKTFQRRSGYYISQFTNILARLDYLSKTKQELRVMERGTIQAGQNVSK